LSIFKSYDIRGVYGKELKIDDASKIGYAFGEWLREHGASSLKVGLGYDVRLSSPALKEAVKSGLMASGFKVIDFGMIPTPSLYFAVAHLALDGGAMVTASHLPSKFNGIKLVTKGGISLSYETGINEIQKRVESGLEYRTDAMGSEERVSNLMDYYWAFIRRAAELDGLDRLKVVVDAGNGSCGYFIDYLKTEGYEVTGLYQDPDGTFPNHVPDPALEENLVELKREVVARGADVGIAFDGDGDRIGVVDNTGNHVTADQLIALLAREELKRNPGGIIVHDILASALIDEVVAGAGGRVVVSRTGHSYIDSAIMANHALMGGEVSGHIYFLDGYYGFDDASFAALKVLSLVSGAKREGKDLAQLVSELPVYCSSPEYRVPCPEEKKGVVIKKLIEALTAAGYKVNTIDGVRVDEPYGWGIARPSNTEEVLSLRFEGRDEESLKKIEQLFVPIIDSELGISSLRD